MSSARGIDRRTFFGGLAAVGGTMFSANAKGTVAAGTPRVMPAKGRNLRIRALKRCSSSPQNRRKAWLSFPEPS